LRRSDNDVTIAEEDGIGLMRPRSYFFVLCFVLAAGFPHSSLVYGKKKGCPVTKAPDPAFVPPPPFEAIVGGRELLYGTPALWTVIYPDWHIHSGGKLPYFRRGYDSRKEPGPLLTVVARRLDGSAPLVWDEFASNATIEGVGMAKMFMVTGVDIPTAGCWEIAARYVPGPSSVPGPNNHIETLTYVVSVEP
jgi:hypothetical protein